MEIQSAKVIHVNETSKDDIQYKKEKKVAAKTTSLGQAPLWRLLIAAIKCYHRVVGMFFAEHSNVIRVLKVFSSIT